MTFYVSTLDEKYQNGKMVVRDVKGVLGLLRKVAQFTSNIQAQLGQAGCIHDAIVLVK